VFFKTIFGRDFLLSLLIMPAAWVVLKVTVNLCLSVCVYLSVSVSLCVCVCLSMCVSLFLKSTNRSGVEWLRRHLQSRGISVHSLIFKGLQNCHADATFMPLSESSISVIDVNKSAEHYHLD